MLEAKSSILLVEDDKDMANLNARMLARQGYEPFVAHTAAEAWDSFREKLHDLFVLDVQLPDGDGYALCGALRQVTDAPVLFLTGHGEPADKVRGLSVGGDYYMTKPFDKNEFLAVVRSLLRREQKVREKLEEATVVAKGSLTLLLREGKALIHGRDAGLSRKEFAILLLLVQHAEQEVRNEIIYQHVWGADMNHDSGALRQRISHLKKKLDEENAEDFAILNEHGLGYAFVSLG